MIATKTKEVESQSPLWICPCGATYTPTEERQRHCTVLVLDDFKAEALRTLLASVVANDCGNQAHVNILEQLK